MRSLNQLEVKQVSGGLWDSAGFGWDFGGGGFDFDYGGGEIFAGINYDSMGNVIDGNGLDYTSRSTPEQRIVTIGIRA